MSINGTLHLGLSSLQVNQAAIQTVGNNIANANDPAYSRQEVILKDRQGIVGSQGQIIGQGVRLDGIERQVDNALLGRLRNAISDREGSGVSLGFLKQIESAFNELSDDDLSSRMSQFFNSWNDLSNRPADVGQRQVVLREGKALADQIQSLQERVMQVADDVDARLDSYIDRVNELGTEIAQLNDAVVRAEQGGNLAANNIRDRRDELLTELSQFANIHTIESPEGSIDVYVGSEPLVTAARSFGVSSRIELDQNGQEIVVPTFGNGNDPIKARSGVLGGINETRELIQETLDRLDALAGGLIYEMNKVHSTGQGLIGYSDITSSNELNDATAALDSADADVPFEIKNGSFVLSLRNRGTGEVNSSTVIDVNLDGTAGGDSLTDLAAKINAVDGVSASVVNNKLRISSVADGEDVVFSEDTSHALAALGIGGFFEGTGAADIRTSSQMEDVRRLAVSRNFTSGDNTTARMIASLETRKLDSLAGATLDQTYEAMAFDVATKIDAATTEHEATASVYDTLEAQRQSISGVNLDEEAVSLIRYQRSYQASARLVAAVDEMLQTILQLA